MPQWLRSMIHNSDNTDKANIPFLAWAKLSIWCYNCIDRPIGGWQGQYHSSSLYFNNIIIEVYPSTITVYYHRILPSKYFWFVCTTQLWPVDLHEWWVSRCSTPSWFMFVQIVWLFCLSIRPCDLARPSRGSTCCWPAMAARSNISSSPSWGNHPITPELTGACNKLKA